MTYATSLLFNTTVYARGCIQYCNTTGINKNGVLSPGIYCCNEDLCNNLISLTKNTNKAGANTKIELGFLALNYLILIFNSLA